MIQIRDYSEKDKGLLLKDMSSLMLYRIQGGYHLDTIQRNCQLSTKFKGCE